MFCKTFSHFFHKIRKFLYLSNPCNKENMQKDCNITCSGAWTKLFVFVNEFQYSVKLHREVNDIDLVLLPSGSNRNNITIERDG